ncbi:hypothetical protein BU16DRAFT_561707 [Lophium mytilinum]|uniref:Uncharacterized protein n=1 Tax=Lophium mytilinum TaxID=390894 RepID=A0A6A6QSD5_9PEZI|nr:hypothetical protein BU16DRAFT_561707 [Lophium mytilinum]
MADHNASQPNENDAGNKELIPSRVSDAKGGPSLKANGLKQFQTINGCSDPTAGNFEGHSKDEAKKELPYSMIRWLNQAPEEEYWNSEDSGRCT